MTDDAKPAAPAVLIPNGQSFIVSETLTLQNERGRLLAKYQPGLVYTVTDRNRAVIAEAYAAGKVQFGEAAAQLRASLGGGPVKGKVSIAPGDVAARPIGPGAGSQDEAAPAKGRTTKKEGKR